MKIARVAALTPAPFFLRGDVNWDEERDLSDGVVILDALFGDPTRLDCPDAADLNDDGELDISDAIGLFSYLFLGGFTPPPPCERVASDLTSDSLNCE